jgi:hypothetical protein
LVTIGLFGFRDWTASADSQEVEDFRQGQPEPLMAYTFTGRNALPDQEFSGGAEDVLRGEGTADSLLYAKATFFSLYDPASMALTRSSSSKGSARIL